MAKRSLDCKGISCPKPLIRISKEVRSLLPGDELEVTATDPNFPIDVQAWADRTGNFIVYVDEEDEGSTALIRVS